MVVVVVVAVAGALLVIWDRCAGAAVAHVALVSNVHSNCDIGSAGGDFF